MLQKLVLLSKALCVTYAYFLFLAWLFLPPSSRAQYMVMMMTFMRQVKVLSFCVTDKVHLTPFSFSPCGCYGHGCGSSLYGVIWCMIMYIVYLLCNIFVCYDITIHKSNLSEPLLMFLAFGTLKFTIHLTSAAERPPQSH